MATTTGPVFTLPIRLTVGNSTCETGVLEINGGAPVGPQLAAGMRELADVLRDVADGLDADEDQEVTTP